MLITSDKAWDEVLLEAGIIDIVEDDSDGSRFRPDIYLLVSDGSFYHCRYPRRFINDMKIDWGSFSQLDTDNRVAITEALLEDRETKRHPLVRHVPKLFTEYMEEKKMQQEFKVDEDR